MATVAEAETAVHLAEAEVARLGRKVTEARVAAEQAGDAARDRSNPDAAAAALALELVCRADAAAVGRLLLVARRELLRLRLGLLRVRGSAEAEEP